MDPDTCLEELRQLLGTKPDMSLETLVNSVREKFDALDGWLKSGGFLPEDWSRPSFDS